MKKSNIGITLIYTVALLFLASVVLSVISLQVQAASITPIFPDSLNAFSEGDVIEEEDWNAIEEYLGIRSSTATSSLAYQLTNSDSINPGHRHTDITSTPNLKISGNATTTGWFNIGVTDVVGSAINIGAGDLFVGANATVTDNLNIAGYASTTNLVLADGASNLGTYNDIYVSGGNLFFNATQLGSGSGTNDWQFIFDNAITSTTTATGIYITASSTVAANFRVDGTFNVTGNATSSGWFNVGNTDVVGTLGGLIGNGDLYVSGNATVTNTFAVTNGTNGVIITAGATTTFGGF